MIPGDELRDPRAPFVERSEGRSWIFDPVFRCSEERLGERVVVGRRHRARGSDHCQNEAPATGEARSVNSQPCWLELVMSGMIVTMKGKDKVMPAGEFKAKCLSVFDEVETRRRSYLITKRGRPVARIVPLASQRPSSLRGSLLHEDGLLDPVSVEWDAQS